MLTQQQGRVSIEEGVVFGQGGERDLQCDVFQPPEPGTRRPAVLLLHGGGWQQGDRTQLKGYGIALARLGFVCVASEYRLSGEASWPAQIHDCKAALRWMRANAEQLGIDVASISVSGNSAGAHLALMLGATPNDERFEGEGGHAGVGTECKSIISIYAPTLLGTADSILPDAIEKLFGGAATAEALAEASPINYVAKGFPPTLLLHGAKDVIVPPAASVTMYDALESVGVDAELHIFANAPHAFDAEPGFGRQCTGLMALFLERYGLLGARA